jgi:hypothetical protein
LPKIVLRVLVASLRAISKHLNLYPALSYLVHTIVILPLHLHCWTSAFFLPVTRSFPVADELLTVCKQYFVKYKCQCVERNEFVQCEARRDTNVRCDPLLPATKNSQNYCKNHTVTPAAPLTMAMNKRYFPIDSPVWLC